jgi:Phospholipase_D-nuclease N-terminal/Short C-terminal domain
MPLLDVFWTMMWFFLWVLWFFLLFRVIMDIFRSRDLGGWGKAGWLVFVVVLPFLGVLGYVIARGGKMADRDAANAQAQGEAAPAREGAHGNGSGNGSTADELAKLAGLHDHGALSDADYERGKEKILSQPAA